MQQLLDERAYPVLFSGKITEQTETFQTQIAQEFISGSAIAPSLYQAAVAIHRDLELDHSNEPTTPIHNALNWRYSRFGLQAKTELWAALLINEDGSCWQAKLSQPRSDRKGKLQKYETPKGNGSRAFLPEVPRSIRQQIGDRYGVAVPVEGSFWQWLPTQPQIPIVLTEGGKKALSLLSQGYVAIALYGVNGGYYKSLDGTRTLIADLQPFVSSGRQFRLAFDQDTATKTRRRVAVALDRLGRLLAAAGAAVTVAQWQSQDGKGVDDLIVNRGIAVWEQAEREALSLDHWRIWQRLAGQLTHSPALQVNAADLSQVALDLPSEGLIAIASPKASGKTKLIAQQVRHSEKVLSAGHRIALQRQLCERLRLDYIGDVDKAQGRFISGASYTLRVGFCVDSLLAIDPSQFAGCDLIGDEWTQLLRHLLTSSTCAKDGRRPALLARLRELVRVAKRVIVADADLDNATLHYLQELRGDAAPLFLIRNDYHSQGYPVRFVEAADRSPIVADLLTSIAALNPGQAEFVATDSKTLSKTLARLIQQQHPGVKVLLLNSETIGNEVEAWFNRTPDLWLAEAVARNERLVVIASPTLATGASIECSGVFQRVWGIFMGVSSTDADMSQSLGRVREPVPRVVWCAQFGSNFSRVSRSTNPLTLKAILQSKTSATVSLIRSSLKEDIAQAVTTYNWQADPHLDLYCQLAAAQNRSMLALRDALLVRLRFEGNSVTVEARQPSPVLRLLLSETRAELQALNADKIVRSQILTLAERLQLENHESLSEAEALAARRFDLCDFYAIEPTQLTTELVLADKEGRRRGELLSLESLLDPAVAADRTVKALEKQVNWNQGLCPWDVSSAELRRQLRESIGIHHFLDSSKQWTKYDLQPYAERVRALAAQIKAALNFTAAPGISDTQIMHQLLSQLGVKLTFRWSCKVSGYEGEKLRVYTLDSAHWQEIQSILGKRAANRHSQLSTAIAQIVEPGLATRMGHGFSNTICAHSHSGDNTHTRSPLHSELIDWAGDPFAVIQQGATILTEAVAKGAKAALAAWQDWQPELRASVLERLLHTSESTLDQLSIMIPDLFLWCSGDQESFELSNPFNIQNSPNWG